MKTTLIILSALALVAVASPFAAASPPPGEGFGHCELVWYSYGQYTDPVSGEEKSLDAPGGWYCVW